MSIRLGDKIIHVTGTQVQSDWNEEDITRPGYIRNKPDVATIGPDGKVNPEQLPSLDYIPNDEKGEANGVATLDDQGLIPSSQIPEDAMQDKWWLLDGAEGGDVPPDYPIDLDEDVARWLFARLSEKVDTTLLGAADGIATLGQDGKVHASQLPPLDYIPNTEKGVSVATLNSAGKVPSSQLPPLDYIPNTDRGQSVATLGDDGKVPASQLPSLDYIPNSEKGVSVATLGSNGKVPSSQLPPLDYIPNTEKGVSVATLGQDGKVPTSQLPALDYVPLTRKVNGKALSSDISLTPSDIGSLATADTPVSLGVSMDPSTYVLTLQLKNSSNVVLDTKTVDLPLETMVVSASYSNGNLTLTLQSGQTLTVDISDIVYGLVNSDELGTPGGVAQLDENGKVPAEQLPEMDYIPNDEKGAANGVAQLNSSGKVPSTQLPYANSTTLGAVQIDLANGIGVGSTGKIGLNGASEADIDGRVANKKAIVPGKIDYAVRSVLPNITVIPADTTSYALKDASATTNSHSWTYVHTPSEATTYVFPAVTTTNVVHAITLIIDFSTVQTYAFEDSEGNALLPLFTPSISQGDVYAFKCEYSVVQSKWLIYPVKEGGVGDDYVMRSQVGAANGVAGLDSGGKVPSGELPYGGTTDATAGAVWTTGGWGLSIDGNGRIHTYPSTTSEISTRTPTHKPIVPATLNYAVTAALTDAHKIQLTDVQKASAQDTLGVGPAPLILTTAPTTSTVGAVGQLAVNTSTSKTYHCTAVNVDDTDPENVVTTYTWVMDVNSTLIGVANGVAELNSSGKVPSECIPKATGSNIGGVRIDGNYGVAIGSASIITISRAENNTIDYRSSIWQPVVASKLEYAVRSVLPNITTIPSSTTSYNLLDASAMTNQHSMCYEHIPAEASIYVLPDIITRVVSEDKYFNRNPATDGVGYYGWISKSGGGTTNRYTTSATPAVGDYMYTYTALTGAHAITAIDKCAHDIILLVSFANTQSIAFEDSQGNTIAPLDTLDIVQGDVVEYICSWDWLQDTWVISASHRKPKPAPPLPTYTDGDALEY